MYSMLRSTIQAKHNINIHNYVQVIQFLKKNSKGYEVKKAKILTSEQCQQFIKEAPDDEYLAVKVKTIIFFHEYSKAKTHKSNFEFLGSFNSWNSRCLSKT